MTLSHDEKMLADAAYSRLHRSGRFRGGGFGVLSGLIISLPSYIHTINDPHTSHRSVVFFSSLLGFVFGMCVIASILIARQRKRDEALVRFFENRFPDDCSWKQEEQILAEVEDIRLKAKVASLIHQSTQ